jgi:DNA-binding IclR family transcriptional regulator
MFFSRSAVPRAPARHANPAEAHARAAERKLLKAMADDSNLSVIALANVVDASRSATGERLRRLAQAGTVEKDHGGHWRLAEKEPRSSGEEARPTVASPT